MVEIRQGSPLISRLLIGLLQGLLLYFLYYAMEAKFWPATNEWIFVPLVMVAVFVPILLVQGIGNIRWKTLLIWSMTAVVLLWLLTDYDLWRRWLPDVAKGFPSLDLINLSMTFFFISQALITGSDMDRRFMARYPTYFDVSWKLAVQIVLSSIFLGVFWGLLYLGGVLFHVLGFDFFENFIEKRWFAFPATTLVFNAALHVTDVQANLVRGIRSLVLTLLSWLLPLLTLILVGFLIALIVAGLKPLAHKDYVMCILTVSVETLIILINTAYQDGNREQTMPRILRYAGTVGAVILLPLTILSIYSLSLRVSQDGWTVDWVYVAAYLVIVSAYALCYLFAAFKRGPWLKWIEISNFIIALLILVIILALLTPIADPARLSVPSQLARSNFTYLRWEGERFGQHALLKLKQTVQGPQAAATRDRINAVLAATSQYPQVGVTQNQTMTVHTPDGRLPESFMQQKWDKVKNVSDIPPCLLYGNVKCDAWLMDLKGDKHMQIVVLQGFRLAGFTQNSEGVWEVIGTWRIETPACDEVKNATQAGQFQPIPPAPQPWPDLQAAGQRLHYSPPYSAPSCRSS